MTAIKKYLAEFLGTMILVVFGCGVAIATSADVLTTAVAFGLVIVAMAYSIGSISGCHINPAVSIAMLCSGKMSFKDFIGYVCAQCLGAIAGAAILGLIFGFGCSFGANDAIAQTTGGRFLSLGVEVMLTAVFVFAILGVTSKKSDFSRISGIVIGFTLILVHLLGIGLTGTSVNPARSLGPAIFAGGTALSNIWIFIVGPLAGGILAAIAWRFLAGKEEQ